MITTWTMLMHWVDTRIDAIYLRMTYSLCLCSRAVAHGLSSRGGVSKLPASHAVSIVARDFFAKRSLCDAGAVTLLRDGSRAIMLVYQFAFGTVYCAYSSAIPPHPVYFRPSYSNWSVAYISGVIGGGEHCTCRAYSIKRVVRTCPRARG